MKSTEAILSLENAPHDQPVLLVFPSAELRVGRVYNDTPGLPPEVAWPGQTADNLAFEDCVGFVLLPTIELEPAAVDVVAGLMRNALADVAAEVLTFDSNPRMADEVASEVSGVFLGQSWRKDRLAFVREAAVCVAAIQLIDAQVSPYKPTSQELATI